MSVTTENPTPGQSGLAALVLLLRFHGVGADPEQIRHRFGTDIGVAEMLRCGKEFGSRRACTSRTGGGWPIPRSPASPCSATGATSFSARPARIKVLVQDPLAPRPAMMTRAEFEAVWDGRLVLMAGRAGLLDLARRFDVTWFLGAIHKYRHLLGEVLVASFFLQLFALVSPLFFQVVIDKVLVNRTLSTLDVLVIGLVAISVFETILSILRTYLFAHTTNRIDVELGARLFRHLLALPIAYFQARRVGDSVARVRELENIRNFLTSSALTLVIDLFFTFVFLAVMFIYSPLLSFIVLGCVPVLYRHFRRGDAAVPHSGSTTSSQRGAENQAFLVESVTGVETLKSMAVEPQMQRRWEEQIAGYVASSFRVISLANNASNAVQLISKMVTAGDTLFRRQAGDRRPTHGRRTGGIQYLRRPRQLAGAAHRRRSGRISTRRASRSRGSATSSIRRRSRPSIRAAPHCLRSAATSPSTMSPSATASTGRRCCTTCISACPPARSSASSAPRGRARARSPS